ncbi:hypothetical protein BWZ20_14355 [Winogradskyella sp. J14-2]|uniref:glycoside hydrolase family 172 protein n=1 Tax=Winogradskyella sp. J14-2 TaxID=1936080 RepID=UPI000972E922|nr:glycoside hydrolase family 172 protein [Winogradskyella sp. J14-2]APY09415.1 hypothetical protein BWZ20_14355 [Winogradskyella sp. J14-2]
MGNNSAKKILIFLCGLYVLACNTNNTDKSQNYISYVDLVNKLTDLRQLAKLPEKGEKSAMWSSYDRASKIDSITGEFINWDANIDGLRPQYIRKEGEYEVLAEMEGPGAIVRIWSASPRKGKVKIYIDGNDTPIIDESFIDYFKPSVPAFSYSGLVYETNAKGFNNYVSISYNKSCKIVAELGWGQYYQFNYITFPDDVELEDFSPVLNESQVNALQKTDDFFNNHLGKSPYSDTDFERISKKVTLNPKDRKTVVSLSGAKAITELSIKIKNRDSSEIAELLRKTSIVMKWDGSSDISVWSPLGDFFGTAPGWNNYKTLPMGMTEEHMYSYWYMPFSNGAEIILENDYDKAVDLELLVSYETLENDVENYGRFHAKWHRDLETLPKDRWPDWKWLETHGKGRFVGAYLLVWNPKGGSYTKATPGHHWWGEGDEKFFVDGEEFPSTFGTGTEDYFGYAWCNPSFFEKAYHSQSLDNDNMGYQPMTRWQIIDNIPFQKSFDAYLEKYFPNEWPTQYATTVYWYLEPDGKDNLGKVPLKDRYAYETPYEVFRKENVIEAEHLKIKSNSGGWASTDVWVNENLYSTTSGHKIMLWSSVKNKDNKLSLSFDWPNDGVYEVYANVVKLKNGGVFGFSINNHTLKNVDFKTQDSLRTEVIHLGRVKLNSGEQNLNISFKGNTFKEANGLQIDYLELKRIN